MIRMIQTSSQLGLYETTKDREEIHTCVNTQVNFRLNSVVGQLAGAL